MLIIILFSFTFDSFGQRKNKLLITGPPTELDDSIATANYKCIYRNNYSLEQRLGFYPFNKAKKIILISYNDTSIVENTTPIKNKRIDFQKVKETRTLNDLEIDSLTSILYNIGVKSSDYWMQIGDSGAKCYNPRNSIIFLNEKEQVIDYIEICFECHRDRLSSKKIMKWESCETKFMLLQDFFLLAGIKIGTTKQVD